MSQHRPDTAALASYVLGALDDGERRDLAGHLTTCARCRAEVSLLAETRAVLDAVPPEAFLDGPPDGDLVLQRTLRAVRSENSRADLRRRSLVAVAAGIVAAVALAGGLLVGRSLGESSPVAQPPGPTGSAPAPAPTGVAVA